jgi:hypothetical protein
MKKNRLINFHIRFKTAKALSEIATFLEQKLNLHFVASQDKFDIEHGGAMLADALGFNITLAFNFKDDDSRRSCQFIGVINYQLLNDHWDERIDLSNFMIKYFETKGIEGWYEPTTDELRKDVDLK